jgi:hypothetical protein
LDDAKSCDDKESKKRWEVSYEIWEGSYEKFLG